MTKGIKGASRFQKGDDSGDQRQRDRCGDTLGFSGGELRV